jgi:hypothetical protein
VYHLLGAGLAERERAELDGALGVAGWPGPAHRWRPSAPREPGAPSWWHGDEEASQSFLAAMGVRLQ